MSEPMSRSSASAGSPQRMAPTRLGQVGHEPIVDGRPGDDARGGGAVLARVPVAPQADVLDGVLEVRVVEDDDRRLAARARGGAA